MTTVLISGANRGIGLEFARRYAADGASVIATARDPDGATELKAVEGVEVYALDVADDASVAHLRGELGDRPIDILIANAGTYGGDAQDIGRLDFEAWADAVQTNSLGPVRLAQAFLPNLKAGEGKTLVAITSAMGSTAQHDGHHLIYRASKAALNNAWAGLAEALKGDGIVCLPLHPGWVRTDMGGKGADLTPEQSVEGLRARIAEAGPDQSGRYQDYAGKALPW